VKEGSKLMQIAKMHKNSRDKPPRVKKNTIISCKDAKAQRKKKPISLVLFYSFCGLCFDHKRNKKTKK
jgi:hypothetical protein